MRKTLLIYVVVAMLSLSLVCAAGIGPGRRVFEFSSDKTLDTYLYVSADNYPTTVRLVPIGDVQEFIHLDTAEVKVNGPMTRIDYSIAMPENSTKRIYTGGIQVIFLSGQGAGMVNAQLELTHQVWITDDPSIIDQLTLNNENGTISGSSNAQETKPSEKPPLAPGLDIKIFGIIALVIIIVFLIARFFMNRPEEISPKDIEKLHNYIGKMRKAKFSDDFIEAELIESGWPRDLVLDEMKK